MLASIGVLLAAVAATPSPSTDLTRPRLQVQIQVERDVALGAADVRAIASGIRAIWAPVLDVVVSPAAISAPAAIDSIRLVITNRTLDMHDSTGLGWIGFVDGEPQPSVTVSYEAARRLAESGEWLGVPLSRLPQRASRLFFQRALAQAGAHEVGHYLLRSRDHTRRGLMRAAFTVEEIMDTRSSLNRLDPDAIAKLRLQHTIARQETRGNREPGIADR